MSSVLHHAASKLKTSAPVFVGKLSDSGQTIEFTVKTKYNPHEDPDLDKNDPMDVLAIQSFRESYNRNRRVFVKDDVIASMFQIIRSKLLQYLDKYSDYRNARQSKVFRWLKYANHSSAYSNGLILLYQYAAKNSSGNDFFAGGRSNPHMKNVIAILERMREKYDKE